MSGAFVTRVKDKPVSVDDRSWPKVLAVSPKHRAGGCARSAEDALRGVIVAFSLFRALQAFFGWLVTSCDKERHDFTVGREKRFHVDDEVFDDRQPFNGFHSDGTLFWVEVFEEHLARQPVATIDTHRIGTTDPVSAGTTECQRPVVIP